MRVVLDASVAFKWFVNDEDHVPEARAIFAALQTHSISLIAPVTAMAELGHALRAAFLEKRVAHADLLAACKAFEDAPVDFVGLRGLTAEAMNLAVKHHGSYYDALYVALALREGINLVTADTPMCNAFAKAGCCIHIQDFAL